MDKITSILQRTLVAIIRLYRLCLSPLLGDRCRFYPSCSSYTENAVQQWGVFAGSLLGIRRIMRCHPACEGGFDPVPLNLQTTLPKKREAE